MSQKLAFHLLHIMVWGSVFPSCTEIDGPLAPFLISHQSTFVIEPATRPIIPFGAVLPPIVSQSEVAFDISSPENIKEVVLVSSKITIISPSGRDLSFLKSLHTYIVAQGSADKLLAFRDPISDDVGNVLFLHTSAEDFREHIQHGKYSLRIRTAVDEVLSEKVELNIELEFRVLAELWE